MMKEFFNKINKSRNEVDDLDSGYEEYYRGAYDRTNDRSYDQAEQPAERRPADADGDARSSYADSRDYRDTRDVSDARGDRYDRYDRYDGDGEGYYETPRGGWREEDSPAYRERMQNSEIPAEKPAEPVFTPAPAPEYLYFKPASYRDCREGIVKGLASGHVVVIRVGGVPTDEMYRLFDYMMGAVAALDAQITRLKDAPTTVVLVPKDVELRVDDLEPEDDTEYEDGEDYDEDDAEYENDEDYDEEEDAEYEDDEDYGDESEDDEEYDEDAYGYDEEEDGEYEEESDEDAE